ncbi:hypothetical protein EVAR_52598_1 [Eumeta japonica]|uniref:Uncharacterized protein n=1 Tax=Eumeta variegata TaxID=151549 RepID=A0A4C1YP65_EUMVA|nr:hypothetical protein EVAR_52598_1 [Eumeta japonica]
MHVNANQKMTAYAFPHPTHGRYPVLIAFFASARYLTSAKLPSPIVQALYRLRVVPAACPERQPARPWDMQINWSFAFIIHQKSDRTYRGPRLTPQPAPAIDVPTRPLAAALCAPDVNGAPNLGHVTRTRAASAHDSACKAAPTQTHHPPRRPRRNVISEREPIETTSQPRKRRSCCAPKLRRKTKSVSFILTDWIICAQTLRSQPEGFHGVPGRVPRSKGCNQAAESFERQSKNARRDADPGLARRRGQWK